MPPQMTPRATHIQKSTTQELEGKHLHPRPNRAKDGRCSERPTKPSQSDNHQRHAIILSTVDCCRSFWNDSGRAIHYNKKTQSFAKNRRFKRRGGRLSLNRSRLSRQQWSRRKGQLLEVGPAIQFGAAVKTRPIWRRWGMAG
ncbi:hypothetical protein SPHINGO391_480107 [Sphingomonas aurantiaca]|uniref:Uncharacterized protein n=1 Tax=Sphingomonas aurantiaca TaxID=185949 RepID=A0A5E8A0K0_9SPHN|nr:hypothetical protein SPHINGO391_480107 [Sphingomonas aurantiaca]